MVAPGLRAVNAVLAKWGHPLHHEPASLPPLTSRSRLGGFPRPWIRYLHRAYVLRKADPTWVAVPLAEHARLDAEVDDEAAVEIDATMQSHLLCHSYKEGYYLPVDFPHVMLIDERDPLIPGFSLCSSYGLMNELVMTAPALGILLEQGQLSDTEAGRIAAAVDKEEGCYRELAGWLLMFECARLSIAHKTAIVFG